MAEPLKICLYDAGNNEDHRFRTPFEQLSNVMIVGEASCWDELWEYLKYRPVDLVAVNMGNERERGLAIVSRILDKKPNCSVVGVSCQMDSEAIIAAMRAGCSQYVTWPVDMADLRAAIERIRMKHYTASLTCKRICVVGSAGGAGATMVACNLTMELATLAERRSVLVDLNLEYGDVATCFDCEPIYTLADVCRQGSDIDRTLLCKAVHELPCNISIIGRPKSIEDVIGITPDAVSSMLSTLGMMFPYVVVDLPRNYSYLNAAAVTGADHVLIVTQLGVPFIRNATRVYDCLLQMGMDEKAVQIVLNRYDANSDQITPEEVQSYFRQPILAKIPNDYRRVQASIDRGQPIVADSPASPARIAIQRIARLLVGEEEKVDATNKPKGLFGRLWGRKNKAVATR